MYYACSSWHYLQKVIIFIFNLTLIKNNFNCIHSFTYWRVVNVCMPLHTCGSQQRSVCRSNFFPSTTWGLGIELRQSVLAASVFTHSAFSSAQNWNLFTWCWGSNPGARCKQSVYSITVPSTHCSILFVWLWFSFLFLCFFPSFILLFDTESHSVVKVGLEGYFWYMSPGLSPKI